MSTASHRNPTRAAWRALCFGSVLCQAASSFQMLRLSAGASLTPRDRAEWLHDAAKRALRRIGVQVIPKGAPPFEGLVVSNHLSYLDVLVYASIIPCLFVSKQEVRDWPLFGHFATKAGTIFIDRDRSAENRAATSMMEQAILAGLPVLLFPEGTSSDGQGVLSFRSPFFEPAIRANAWVSAAAIGYRSSTAAEPDLCYFGDDVFGPHLLRTLGQRDVSAEVRFARSGRQYADRKEAARATRLDVMAMRAAMRQTDDRAAGSRALTRAC